MKNLSLTFISALAIAGGAYAVQSMNPTYATKPDTTETQSQESAKESSAKLLEDFKQKLDEAKKIPNPDDAMEYMQKIFDDYKSKMTDLDLQKMDRSFNTWVKIVSWASQQKKEIEKNRIESLKQQADESTNFGIRWQKLIEAIQIFETAKENTDIPDACIEELKKIVNPWVKSHNEQWVKFKTDFKNQLSYDYTKSLDVAKILYKEAKEKLKNAPEKVLKSIDEIYEEAIKNNYFLLEHKRVRQIQENLKKLLDEKKRKGSRRVICKRNRIHIQKLRC